MSRAEATFVGEVQSVNGALVSIQLRDDLHSALLLVDGESYRVGQIGAFVRIPLGYTSLYGICTQVGAQAALAPMAPQVPAGSRWMTAALFGESLSGNFERGVGQYPTVGDEVHLVTKRDLEIIYGSLSTSGSVAVGTLGASSGIPGFIDVDRFISRHAAIVGSTGSGKSNLVATLLEALTAHNYPSARIVVIDPHGEYGSAIGNRGYVYRVNPVHDHERPLVVPFWALPFDELQAIAFGPMQPGSETAVRDAIVDLKTSAAMHLAQPPATGAITADSPVPFSMHQLWFDLDDYERQTLSVRTPATPAPLVVRGDPGRLISNAYPDPGHGTTPPFLGNRRGITRQLNLLRSRLQDGRYRFLFSPGSDYSPELSGKTVQDLDSLVASWIAHDRQITVLDLSGLPSEVMSTIAGTLLRIVYDTLFWSGDSPAGGKSRPLLVVLEEAHRILPAETSSAAHRTAIRVAKEGRKFGVGLLVVTQRPTEIDASVLSQCGTMIALRMSNSSDRSVVTGMMPDDLGELAAMLPALRTGEGLVMGEAMPIPSRIRFNKASVKPDGDDPKVARSWSVASEAIDFPYRQAIHNWRAQTFFPES